MRLRFSSPPPGDQTPTPLQKQPPEQERIRHRPHSFRQLYEMWLLELRRQVDSEAVADLPPKEDFGIIGNDRQIVCFLTTFYRLFALSPLLGDPVIRIQVLGDRAWIHISAALSPEHAATGEATLLGIDPSYAQHLETLLHSDEYTVSFIRDKYSLTVRLTLYRYGLTIKQLYESGRTDYAGLVAYALSDMLNR